jgi:hypothetical protein
MNRSQLEHVLRAAGSVSSCREMIVIGSQALLGSYADAPADLMTSMEVDLYPLDAPEKADLIDGSIGELSPFHETFGYYAHGVGPETASLPAHWKTRLVRVETPNTAGTVGLCLSPVDLAISKLLAGREKDIEFVRGMLRAGLVTNAVIQTVLGELTLEHARLTKERLARCR